MADQFNIAKMNDEYYKCLSLINTMTINSFEGTYNYITLWKNKWKSKNTVKENILGFHKWEEYISNSNYINSCYKNLVDELNNKYCELLKEKAKIIL